MVAASSIVTRSVLSDDTYAVIRDFVLDHEIAPGQRVSIDAMSERLGVSPTPIREALARLESDGLVVKTPLRGYSTTPVLDPREFLELMQFRVVIEQWTAEHAATSPAPGLAALFHDELRQVRKEVGQRGSGPKAFRALTEHDARFHELVASAAGNNPIKQSFERTHFHLHFLRLYLAALGSDEANTESGRSLREIAGEWETQAELARTIDQHSAIAEAIIRHDGSTASRLMREHITESSERTMPIVESLSHAAAAKLGPK